MKFYEYPTLYQYSKQLMGKEAVDLETLKRGFSNIADTKSWYQFITEYNWIKARRPYYNIYPKIANAFLRTKLNCQSKYINLPVDPLCLRLSEDKPLMINGCPLKTILAAHLDIKEHDTIVKGLFIWADFGESETFDNTMPVLWYFSLPLIDEILENNINYCGHISLDDKEKICMFDALRIVASVCLLGDDDDFLIPDVISGDRQKFEKTKDQKYIDKAHRRGKIGWNLGQAIEVNPHIRVPHMAIRWTGPGATIPQLTKIKGSIIHKELIDKVPTDLQGDL